MTGQARDAEDCIIFKKIVCYIDRTDLSVSLSCYTNEKNTPGCDTCETSLNITPLRACALIRYFLPFTAKDSDTISEICC